VNIQTFLPVLNSPDSVLNLSGLIKNKGKTHYHDGSLLILNTTFLSFLSTLNGCLQTGSPYGLFTDLLPNAENLLAGYLNGYCDPSEINILLKIKKKIQLFLSLTICTLF